MRIRIPLLALVATAACVFSSAHARFVSVDPVQVREEGDNFNRFAYGSNNPYAFTDPDGRDGARFYTTPGLMMATPTMTPDTAGVIADAAVSIAIDAALGGPTGEAAVIFGGLRATRAADKANDTVHAVDNAKPLLGRNPAAGGSRTNTDLGAEGNRASAKSVFRHEAEGTKVTTQMSNGGTRTRAENGVQIRHNPDGSSRVDLPSRGSDPNGESIHTPAPKPYHAP